jgi:hypothetical protein
VGTPDQIGALQALDGQSFGVSQAFHSHVSDRPIVWFGASSFEERAATSLVRLAAHERIGRAVLLDYASDAWQIHESVQRRARVVSRIVEALPIDCPLDQPTIGPYGYYDFQAKADEYIAEEEGSFLVFDISCMTKLHAIALAEVLTRRSIRDYGIAYTLPDNYGSFGSGRKMGWRRVIVAPLAESGRMHNEDRSRGVFLPGHEPERLIAALATFEPPGGIVLTAETTNRPDFRSVSERLHSRVFRTLLDQHRWERVLVNQGDWRRAGELIRQQIALAAPWDAPVVLLPYGPKSLVLASALTIASRYPTGAWFAYPVPTFYDVNYSEGEGPTMWFHLTHETMP